MLDILLDKFTHDLDLSTKDIVLIDGKERLLQQLKIRLETIHGEWFLDTTVGVEYYEAIWVKNPNLTIINAIIKKVILTTEDIVEVMTFSSSLNAAERKLTISFTAMTTFGIISFSEKI